MDFCERAMQGAPHGDLWERHSPPRSGGSTFPNPALPTPLCFGPAPFFIISQSCLGMDPSCGRRAQRWLTGVAVAAHSARAKVGTCGVPRMCPTCASCGQPLPAVGACAPATRSIRSLGTPVIGTYRARAGPTCSGLAARLPARRPRHAPARPQQQAPPPAEAVQILPLHSRTRVKLLSCYNLLPAGAGTPCMP